MFLVPIAGPAIEPFVLDASRGPSQGLTLGRHEQCELKLPATAETVSRFHARLRFDPGGGWRVSDLGSRWGTFLNGVKLTPHGELPIGEGDLIRINPWTFSVGGAPRRRGMATADDLGQTIVRTATGAPAPGAAVEQDMLALLLEAAAAIHDAADEAQLSERLIDAAVRGSGLPNAAVLRPVDTGGRVEVLASRLAAGNAAADAGGGFAFSRSLLAAAADGRVAQIEAGGAAPVSQSIVQMNIAAAMCVPLMLGPAPAAYLYLDARASRPEIPPASIRPTSPAFCAALGRLAGLALANLKRVDIERRQAAMEHELSLAAAAQRWVLPPRDLRVGQFFITGESRPGRYVGGDFFDVIDLGDGRIAVALGDVTGKGVEASVLMTATQGFLHAALKDTGDPGKAVTAANEFVSPRRPTNRFVTLWAAVIDPQGATLSYVDAGHSYAALLDAQGRITELNAGGGPPLGIDPEFAYAAEAVPLPASGRVVVVSDGIIEQPATTDADAPGERRQFDMAGMKRCIEGSKADDVAALFEAVVAHAGTDKLADDATAVCVKW